MKAFRKRREVLAEAQRVQDATERLLRDIWADREPGEKPPVLPTQQDATQS
jgi:hypothetical protein